MPELARKIEPTEEVARLQERFKLLKDEKRVQKLEDYIERRRGSAHLKLIDSGKGKKGKSKVDKEYRKLKKLLELSPKLKESLERRFSQDNLLENLNKKEESIKLLLPGGWLDIYLDRTTILKALEHIPTDSEKLKERIINFFSLGFEPDEVSGLIKRLPALLSCTAERTNDLWLNLSKKGFTDEELKEMIKRLPALLSCTAERTNEIIDTARKLTKDLFKIYLIVYPEIFYFASHNTEMIIRLIQKGIFNFQLGERSKTKRTLRLEETRRAPLAAQTLPQAEESVIQSDLRQKFMRVIEKLPPEEQKSINKFMQDEPLTQEELDLLASVFDKLRNEKIFRELR